MAIEQKRELLRESILQLNSHPGFIQFLDALWEMREYAVRSACTNEVIKADGLVLSALGEVRAYEDIFACVDEAVRKST